MIKARWIDLLKAVIGFMGIIRIINKKQIYDFLIRSGYSGLDAETCLSLITPDALRDVQDEFHIERLVRNVGGMQLSDYELLDMILKRKKVI